MTFEQQFVWNHLEVSGKNNPGGENNKGKASEVEV